ncbi:hypothetical protein [Oligosphaera ethanolica]|jgi:hypothetical protein|uniref:Uncharacterized protein n=1 Tax=Oligosphaera ethanolica TaxID=760260 RepID=A0AAE3VD29_9BACT|nr:hypothetical protein [Oligosphaera ethanolica]MDQ0288252.1 hypothetical protein [Oligosphaera ethanolica]MDQ0288257.1 hypothetical protein [Oligosphaera ethanolica]
MVIKTHLRPPRVLAKGYGWADHRLLRDGHLRLCTAHALALYLFLVLAADGDGLSFYGDRLTCHLLGMSHAELEEARNNLLGNGLIAWGAPLYQVLDVPGQPGKGDWA